MKKVSIQELKRSLSSLVSEAASGERILITRHKKTVASLISFETEHLHVGARVGEGGLRPVLNRGTGGRYLEVLLEDRGGGKNAR